MTDEMPVRAIAPMPGNLCVGVLANGGCGFERLNCSAVPEVIVGCGFAAWTLDSVVAAQYI